MATEREATELKQKGAIEAARDPESSVTADDAKRMVVEQSKNAGVAAFTFDPDASPEEKAAQVREVRLSTAVCERKNKGHQLTLSRPSPRDSADPRE
jgi:hypothetical protein